MSAVLPEAASPVPGRPVPWSENERLAELDGYAILDTPPEPEFDDVVRMAGALLAAPVAAINLVARGRQWSKAMIGLPRRETSLAHSICVHTLLTDGGMVIPDLLLDPRFSESPLVVGPYGLRFYAGAPLKTPAGLPLGTLCVGDTEARPDGLTERETRFLGALARQVALLLELRRAHHRHEAGVGEHRRLAHRLRALRTLDERLRGADTEGAVAAAAEAAAAEAMGVGGAAFRTLGPAPAPPDPDAPETLVEAAIRSAAMAAGEGEGEGEGEAGGEGDGAWIAVADVLADPRTRGDRGAALRAHGIAAFARLVVADRNAPVASLLLHGAAPRAWDDDERLFAREIAHRARDAAARLAAASRLATAGRAWQASQDLLMVVDAAGTMLDVNRAWTALLGWEAPDLLGRPLGDITHPDDRAGTLAAFRAVAGAPMTVPHEHRLRHADGTDRFVSWTAAAIGGRVYASGRHTTAVRQEATALRAQEAQVHQRDKMEAVGQLTGGLAHDFNNLLTGIVGSVELLGKRVAQNRLEDVARYIDAAQGAAMRAASLTHRLLSFSRRQALSPEPTDLNRLLRRLAEPLARTAGPAVAVELVLAPDLWTALVDPAQLETALVNLCMNARDAMPAGGRLRLETAGEVLDAPRAGERAIPPGCYVTLTVADTGIGMPPDVVARAFDPFFTTKSLGQGTGLGLSMIYGFARQSGGTVRIASQEGRGTTVSLTLPLAGGAPDVP